MKVYDYMTLQSIIIGIDDDLDVLDYLDYLEEKFGIEDIIEDFYNLPFTPDLITKFFKGWEVDDCSDYDLAEFTNNNNSIEFGEYHDEDLYQIETNESCYIISKPIVLNDFIRDCKRYKIELEM